MTEPNEPNLTNVIWTIIFSLCLMGMLLATCETASANRRSTQLLNVATASCMGEVGFVDRAELLEQGYMTRLDECAAVLRVYTYAYENRWSRRGTSMVSGIRAFSSAVRPRASHPRPWVLRLADFGRSGRRRVDSFAPLFKELVKRWMDGEEFSDPCPGSIDYGGHMDSNPELEVRACEGGATRGDFYWRFETPAPEEDT